MKKFLLTATMLVCLSALSKAQQGRVGINTTTPAATLDVVANTADNTKPDAVLVPRMTRAQLAAKDAAYVAEQNGALTFVTTIDGTATAKTTNVTAVGFYYYDAPSSTWKTLGGGAALPTPTYRTVAGAALVTLLPSDVGNVVLFSGGVSGDIKLPTPDASMVGKKLTIVELSGISQNLTNQNANYKTNTFSSLQQFGSEFITDGTNWYSLAGQ
ncbi:MULTISPECIES: hypothetical protein [Chryseobacterium]|uniref:T9SS C-terminal target domain-containing protein n=1 Tax=Chryseobacterium gallinarum TaxID=1324352 RepID=A0ABX6KVI3_CHRGL|nr:MULTISPECIES: hypothetical protein [Chryseobacterium]MCL8535261.1 hypothetical protein [Chryseobacterium gallinarum]QIY92602.1 hypothetical protein FOB44_18940 [Chryseobacterium gallinarum]